MGSRSFGSICIVLVFICLAGNFMLSENTVPGIMLLSVVIGCALIVIIGNYVLRPLLQRAEDYYGGGDDDE